MEALNRQLRRLAPTFGQELARAAYARGLSVTQKDGSTRPIPITATVHAIEEQKLHRRAELAARLSSATLKMSRAVLAGPDRERLLSALSPLERRMAEATFAKVSSLAVTRVDFFEAQGRAHALEVNATIPAMQGYSDIAAHAFLEVVGKTAGLSPLEVEALKEKNGSNAFALYQALLWGYAQQRQGRSPERIALLCRRNDAQLGEQKYLASRFTAFGTEAEVVHPDQLSGDGEVRARGKRFDLIYRHLFVRRLEETPSPYVEALLAEHPSPRAVVLNPPASQVEVKTSFALLSQALREPELAKAAGLSEDELSAIAESVPWTRPFRSGPGVGPSGDRLSDVVAFVAENPSGFVLKRAWDYGGRAVFVGKDEGTSAFADRVKAAYGEELDWRALCARCAADPAGGGYVVQELVLTHCEPHLICTETGLVEAELFVDFSCYASVGMDGLTPPWGGVCRGSVSHIVNIVGGGGVLPLLKQEVAEGLQRALKAHPPASI